LVLFYETNFMWMILLTLLSALSIASVAAYFSIIGLATLFSATFIPVVIMASTLEVGKLVATSWLYQTWEYSPKLMKAYLSVAIVVLMLVTSMGIFGFLSKGYLDVKHPSTQQEIQIQSVRDDITLIRERMAFIEMENGAYRLELDQMRAVIESYPRNYVTKKLDAYKEQKPRRDEINKGLEENRSLKGKQLLLLRDKNLNLSNLEREKVEIEGDLGPIKYVAQALDVSVDEGVRYVILAIIFVFDPLAVLLILAANISIAHRFGRGKSVVDVLTQKEFIPKFQLSPKAKPAPVKVAEIPEVKMPPKKTETPIPPPSKKVPVSNSKKQKGSSLSPKNRR